MSKDIDSIDERRRQFLKEASLGSAVVAFSGVGASLFSDVANAESSDPDFVLEARAGGWRGEAPEEIDGVTNPTLDLPEPGTEVTVEWTNEDGLRHNFVIQDNTGLEVVRSPVITEGSQTVTFEVTEEMLKYFCEIHPGNMRGDVVPGDTQPEPMVGSGIEAGDPVALEPIATGLVAPLGLEVAPGVQDHRLLLDQTGLVHDHGPDGLTDDPFLDIGGKIVDLGVDELHGYDERGLLGLAFHPNFDQNRKFYVRYSAPRRPGTPEDYDHTELLSEFEAPGNPGELGEGDPDSERVILEMPSPQMNHDGGAVAFGPDGFLYISLGDGGAADDVGPGHVNDWYDENAGGNGQDVVDNLMGSILRIDVDDTEGGKEYAIPDDNPLVGNNQGLDEIFAWGFRNPWRMSFNRVPQSDGGLGDGEKLFVGEVGQNLWEEVAIVENGSNHGWNVREGTHCFSTENPTRPPADLTCPTHAPGEEGDPVRGHTGEKLEDPVVEFPHRRSTTAFIDGEAIIGGFTYENEAVSPLTNRYVFGNWSGDGVIHPDGELFSAAPDGSGLWTIREHPIANTENGRINEYVLGMGRDHEGELYVLTNGNFTPTGENGVAYRIVPA